MLLNMTGFVSLSFFAQISVGKILSVFSKTILQIVLKKLEITSVFLNVKGNFPVSEPIILL